MYLSIPTNWDNRIVDKIREINSSSDYCYKVGSVYGAFLTKIGSGRFETPNISEEYAQEHIRKIKKLGVKFNFVANSPSLGGKEHDVTYREELLGEIERIVNLGVEMITVSIPFLGELINYHFPHIEVKMSTMLDIRDIQHINLINQMGPKVACITLSRFINRNFELLKNMVDIAPFELELLANSLCLHNCPYQMYHSDLVCWQARKKRGWEEPFADYRAVACDRIRFTDKSQVIKSPWIRPEDLNEYEQIGISSIKIAGRTFPTEWIINIVEAYARGSYSGNMWDLILPFQDIYVDNRKLNNFLKHFKNNRPSCDSNCGKCRYCEKIAEDVVSYGDETEEYLIDLEKRLDARINMADTLPPYFKESRV